MRGGPVPLWSILFKGQNSDIQNLFPDTKACQIVFQVAPPEKARSRKFRHRARPFNLVYSKRRYTPLPIGTFVCK